LLTSKTDLSGWPIRILSRSGLVPLIVLSLSVVGCGDRVEVGTLSGKVTYKDKPLEFGSVMLQPVGGGPVARATIQPDGTYSIAIDGKAGAPVGVNKVRVTCYSGQRPGAASTTGEASIGDSLIPEHYTKFSSSGLEVEVKAGENPPYNIEL
jgi:hypothetical protein